VITSLDEINSISKIIKQQTNKNIIIRPIAIIIHDPIDHLITGIPIIITNITNDNHASTTNATTTMTSTT
jgi:hypothetical protein